MTRVIAIFLNSVVQVEVEHTLEKEGIARKLCPNW